MTTHRLATMRTHMLRLLAGGAFLTMCAGQAAAEDTELSQQPFQIALGSFTNESDLTIRADGDTSSGTEIDWGNTFGDVDGTKFRLDGYWRINDRHHIRLMYTENSSVRRKNIENEFTWNDQVFEVDTSVRSEFGFSILELAYEYDFSKREDRELVLSAGLHYTEFNAAISATVNAGGGGATTEIGSEASVGAPLPVIGARGMWNLGGNWWFDAQAQYFQVAIDNIDGSIFNLRGAFIWQPKKWIGVGAGYDTFSIDVDIDRERLDGSIDWTYAGPQIFFNFAF